jgi:hypothetical protein
MDGGVMGKLELGYEWVMGGLQVNGLIIGLLWMSYRVVMGELRVSYVWFMGRLWVLQVVMGGL